jgi:hypothetical protein
MSTRVSYPLCGLTGLSRYRHQKWLSHNEKVTLGKIWLNFRDEIIPIFTNVFREILRLVEGQLNAAARAGSGTAVKVSDPGRPLLLTW